MQMNQLSWKRLVLGSLAFGVCMSASACSIIRYRVHQTLKPSESLTVAYQQGRSEARIDLAAGRLRYLTYGRATEWDGPDLYAQHLRDDYNIELVKVAGCEVTEDLVNRTSGYNETALPVIEARFGNGILERVHQQAVAEWKRRHELK